MLKSYIKSASRSFLQNKLITLISLLGLSFGILSFIYIAYFILNEISFDKNLPEHKRMFRITQNVKYPERTQKYALSPFTTAPTLADYCPQIETWTRISQKSRILVRWQNKVFAIDHTYHTDSTFTNFFSTETLEGNLANSLKQPNTLAISEETKKLFFGNKQAVGKIFHMLGKDYEIKSVFRQQGKSHITPAILLPYSSLSKEKLKTLNRVRLNNYTYIKVKHGEEKNLKQHIDKWKSEYIDKWLEKYDVNYSLNYNTQPISDIHFTTDLDWDISSNAPKSDIYILAGIAFLILLIALINYLNLTTSKINQRFKEISLRKIFGAANKQTVSQFLAESSLFATLSFTCAFLLLLAIAPILNATIEEELFSPSSLFSSFQHIGIIAGVFLFTAVVTILTSLYPALIISSYSPIFFVKNPKLNNTRNTKNKLLNSRMLMMVFQFTISIIIISSTILVNNQFKYINKKDLGFNPNNIFTIHLTNDSTVNKNLEILKQELLKNPEILSASVCRNVPGYAHTYKNFKFPYKGEIKTQKLDLFMVDYDFQKTMGLKITQGRFFNKNISSDKTNSFVINESAARLLSNEPIGKTIQTNNMNGTIIGIINDFHYHSLHNKINPLVIAIANNQKNYLPLRTKTKNKKKLVEFIEATWKKINGQAYLEYRFLSDHFDLKYGKEKKMLKLLKLFSALTVIICCIGILGLISFISERRRKEIGIRKINGATTNHIILLIGKQFGTWYLLACCIACPISWHFGHKWLESFAYKTSFSPWIFVLSTLISLIISIATIGYQTYKSATENPINTLKQR